jgi:hypothetical protein
VRNGRAVRGSALIQSPAVTAQDIITSASQALEAIEARARAREAEILRQRDAALQALGAPAPVPAAADPAAAEQQIAARLAAIRRAASTKAHVTEDDALAAWQAADADAYTKYTRALDAARSGYIALIDTLQDAIHTAASAEQARFIRDRTIAAADAEYRAAKLADYDAYVKASSAAREEEIQTVQRAVDEAEAARQAARAVWTPDGEVRALDRRAVAVCDACDAQLARSKADVEREKADVFARMRADLQAAGQPV